jgi:hypothetical protein
MRLFTLHLFVSIIHIDEIGDPLKDFTNTAFLDRFVYRNPKSLDKAKHSLMKYKAKGTSLQSHSRSMDA